MDNPWANPSDEHSRQETFERYIYWAVYSIKLGKVAYKLPPYYYALFEE